MEAELNSFNIIPLGASLVTTKIDGKKYVYLRMRPNGLLEIAGGHYDNWVECAGLEELKEEMRIGNYNNLTHTQALGLFCMKRNKKVKKRMIQTFAVCVTWETELDPNVFKTIGPHDWQLFSVQGVQAHNNAGRLAPIAKMALATAGYIDLPNAA